MSPASNNPPIVNTEGSISPKAASAVIAPTSGEKELVVSPYDSAEMTAGVDGGSVARRMESIPEEDASKANLHSSHSKVG